MMLVIGVFVVRVGASTRKLLLYSHYLMAPSDGNGRPETRNSKQLCYLRTLHRIE